MRIIIFMLMVFSSHLIKAQSVEDYKQNLLQLQEAMVENIQDSTLVTGWYFISDSSKGYKRQLDQSDVFYFIDPYPILTKANFKKLKIYQSKYNGKDFYGIRIDLNKTGKERWHKATRESVGQSLALIINNELIHTPFVNGEISGGVAALNREIYTKEELEHFMKQMESGVE